MGGKRHRAEDTSVKRPAKKHQGAQVGAINPKPTLQPTTQFLENPKGEELKREVQLYEQLTSEDSAERLQAGDAIVSGLLSGNGVPEAVLTRHLERRLFRGLASGRKAARLGFSMVLTEILGQVFGDETPLRERYANLTFEKLLDILVTKTKPQGDMSGQEERDHAFGLLFGLQCFVRAKMLFRIGGERWEKPLEMLLQLAEKKTWMREECGWIIVEALPQMEQKHAEDTVQKIYDAGLASTPEGVGLWLVARERFPGMNFPDKPWGEDGNPLEHMKALSRALRECADDTEVPRAKKTGHWNPKLHFVWHLLADILMDGISNGDTRVYSQFECFWKVAVDGEALVLRHCQTA
jgi:DNA polymerase phi